MVAARSHRKWVEHLVDCMLNPAAEFMVDPDPRQSRFGRWYQSGGAIRYGTLAEFWSIGPIHEQVNGLGRELLELARAGKIRTAMRRLPELYAVQDKLLAQLDALAHSASH